MRRLNVTMLKQVRGRDLSRIAWCCFAERRRWWEWMPLLGDRWLRHRLRRKWRVK
jgi:hypothetical protein